LTGLAFICFIARISIRLVFQKKLQLDDYFLILAVACLCAATGILYHVCYFLYLHSAALLVKGIGPYLIADLDAMLEMQVMVYPYLAMIWTTTFAVKWCFLAFMRPLVWHISRVMNWYYWFIVGFCTVTWAFLVAEPFIICPYFGLDALKCFYSTVDGKKTLGLTAFVTVLDILSDLMSKTLSFSATTLTNKNIVVSLPIIILRGSQLSRSTKFGLSTFLCLSIFMAVCAIVRVSGFHYHGIEDDTWNFYWQQAEGSTAVMMASITAFRTLFVKPSDDPNMTTPRSPVESFLHKISRRFKFLASAEPTEKGGESASKRSILKMPKMPNPTFTGMRTFIRGNGKTDTTSAKTFNSMDSEMDPLEADYHAALKQNGSSSRAISSRGTSHKISSGDSHRSV
jgi:hypothetical protein